MHRTVSLDYAILLEGCVDLVLDSGESRRLGRGDVVVQRGTAHSFRNVDTDRWCRLLFVFLPMVKLVVKGRELEAEVYDEGFDKSDGEGEGGGDGCDEGGGGDGGDRGGE